MDALFLTTTRNADYVALGTGGQRVIRCWDQITGYLERALGPAHARLFAEPQGSANTGTTDWYAAGNGKAQPLKDLQPEAADEARARMRGLLLDLSATAERLRQSRREDERVLAEILALALIVPSEDAVWVQQRDLEAPESDPPFQPILVGWGQTLNGQQPAPELLIGIAGTRRRPSGKAAMRIIGPPPPPEQPSHWGLWTLLGALLLALLLFLLLLWRDPLGWFRVPAAQCVVDPTHLSRMNELRDAEAREAQLRLDIARITLELGNRRAACPPPAPPPAPPPPRVEPRPPPPTPPPPRAEPTPPPPPSRDVERAQDRGAQTGALQIILAWDDVNDLDLYVTCPDGQQISYRRKQACGGELDIDANVGGTSRTPVENVFFRGVPANGIYRVVVHHFGGSGPATSPFRVTIRQQGRPDRVINGQASRGQQVPVTTVSVPP